MARTFMNKIFKILQYMNLNKIIISQQMKKCNVCDVQFN